ncbi:unnamed protein product [Strongylus vulgaris]|uniref:Sulfur globule protein CV3 n=1 Tax=Strongylus vulgaris TaxID=40348 RepID=A0A3P7I172_STRVU|nr:unnamed protein product [Strongylus vulgaris]
MGSRLVLVLLLIAAASFVEAQWNDLGYYRYGPWGGYGPGMWGGYRPYWRGGPFFGPMMWGGYGMMPWMWGWRRK